MKNRAPRLVLLTTSPLTLRTFFAAQVRFLRSAGFRVHTISAAGPAATGAWRRLPMYNVPMRRKISPISDLWAVFRLCLLLRRIRPAVVHTHTPKAGLLGMIAAKFTGIGVRIYTINGLVWATRKGWSRRLLQVTEWLACSLATDVLTVSESLRLHVITQGICPENKVRLLGCGASHGVDLERFDPAASVARGAELRKRLGIPETALVVTFVGRLVREKGIEELAAAWRTIRHEFPFACLLLCGETEEGDPVDSKVLAAIRRCPGVHFICGQPAEMPAVYAASDLCVLPSWREGLPNAALEAAAMERPIVATKIPGCVDAIQHGVTGLLVEPRNTDSLTSALRSLLSDAPTRGRMGKAARAFVAGRFSERAVSQRLAAEYLRLTERVTAGDSPRKPRVRFGMPSPSFCLRQFRRLWTGRC